MAEALQKPKALSEDHLLFLDALRESGITNMYGATPYLRNKYPYLAEKKSREILTYWMQTFTESFYPCSRNDKFAENDFLRVHQILK